MEVLNKTQIYKEIYNRLNDIAKKEGIKPYKISSKYGISQSNYYDLQDYVNGGGDEKRLLSFYKLKEVAKNFGISVVEVLFAVEKTTFPNN